MIYQKKPLGEIIELKHGKSLPESIRVQGNIPVYGSGGKVGLHNVSHVKGPGIIVGRKGSIGSVYWEKEDFFPIDTVYYVQPIDKDLDLKYLYYLLKYLPLQNLNSDAAVPGLNREIALSYEAIVLPTLISNKVASILSAYDDLIEINLKRIALLEKSARQFYEEWFVRLRFPGYEHTNIINGVPEGWQSGVIEDFYETSSGGTPSRTNPEYYTGEINWVKTQELTDNFIFSTQEKITEEAIKRSSAKLFPENSVIVAMYGATIGQLGILAMPSTTNQACCAILSRNNIGYIYAYLFLKKEKEGLINLSMGATQKNISQNIIRKYPMMMPAQSLLELFEEQLIPCFSQIKNLQQQNQKLKQARDILLPKLINGEIPV